MFRSMDLMDMSLNISFLDPINLARIQIQAKSFRSESKSNKIRSKSHPLSSLLFSLTMRFRISISNISPPRLKKIENE